MTDEIPEVARYVDAVAAPITIDEVSGHGRRSRPRSRRPVAVAIAATVVVTLIVAAVVALEDRAGEPARIPPAGSQSVPQSTTTATSGADVTSRPIGPTWVDDITASDAQLLVAGSNAGPGTTDTCRTAAVDPRTLRLSDAAEHTCVDPASDGEVVVEVDRPIPGTNNETLSIGHVDATTHRVTTGPVVMTYGSYSDTRPITVYAGDWLWIYAVETIPAGSEVLQVSRSTGAVVNTIKMPTLYRPLLAANDDGLWVGESVQGGQCDGCGPPPGLTFVGVDARDAVRVAAAGAATTYWLHADDHHVWASIGSFTHRDVMRFDGIDLRPKFRVPESNLNVFVVAGDEAAGLWSVASESVTAPIGSVVRYDVVRIDPATGQEQRIVRLPPVHTTVNDELPFAVFDGSVYTLELPYRTGFETGFSTIVRVTPH